MGKNRAKNRAQAVKIPVQAGKNVAPAKDLGQLKTLLNETLYETELNKLLQAEKDSVKADSLEELMDPEMRDLYGLPELDTIEQLAKKLSEAVASIPTPAPAPATPVATPSKPAPVVVAGFQAPKTSTPTPAPVTESTLNNASKYVLNASKRIDLSQAALKGFVKGVVERVDYKAGTFTWCMVKVTVPGTSDQIEITGHVTRMGNPTATLNIGDDVTVTVGSYYDKKSDCYKLCLEAIEPTKALPASIISAKTHIHSTVDVATITPWATVVTYLKSISKIESMDAVTVTKEIEKKFGVISAITSDDVPSLVSIK